MSGFESDGQDRFHQSLDIRIDADEVKGPCDATLGVERLNFGTMSGSWGGSALGVRERSQRFDDLPLQ